MTDSVAVHAADVGVGMLPFPETPPPRMPLTPEERVAEAVRLYGEEHAHIVLRTMPGLFDLELCHAVTVPHPSLAHIYESGNAEPWTTQAVASLLIASNQRRVVETGAFKGQTSAWLAMALERVGGGHLTTVDIDADRCQFARERLDGLGLTRTKVEVVHADVLQWIPTQPDGSIGFIWIDDNHEKHHVDLETRLVFPKMKRGGIMTYHDVLGSTDLQTVVRKYGGIALSFPRLGQAGGLGIISIPL